MPRCFSFAVALLAVAGAFGCARPQARVAPVVPPLETPAVPPRVIASLPEEAPGNAPPSTTDAGVAAERPARPVTRPATKPDPVAQQKEPAKPDPPATKPEPPTDSRVNTPQLKTPQSADDSSLEKKIRGMLDRAQRNLGRVDYGALSAEGKEQYDTAKRFIQQADDALKGGNLVYSTFLADKAETLARQLVGRG